MTADLVFCEVKKEQDGGRHSAVVEALEKWCFLPYPECTRSRLEQVNIFFVASCRTPATDTTEGAEDVSSAMVGVVGVVWVPLAPGVQVEGYIQLVLVLPTHRRRHIAQQLLRRALRLVEGGDPSRKIVRWRLHTMTPSQQTTAYLRRVLPESDDSASREQLLEEMERLVAAVPRVYETLGFDIRRNMYAYYDNSADAVEMVKVVQGRENAADIFFFF
ncbi:hypothetical protein C3747_41g268 [Trypanosoma cruzi]|uniref:N-acetyltransferase domain-containing protein n=1 Tax=Trypanosoma cruzi TaxID=5693 RepID=A0A2V2WZS1_TRYCR|nr:hypothetical protein C3747_41g268 [Trypanosoma cruzi]